MRLGPWLVVVAALIVLGLIAAIPHPPASAQPSAERFAILYSQPLGTGTMYVVRDRNVPQPTQPPAPPGGCFYLYVAPSGVALTPVPTGGC